MNRHVKRIGLLASGLVVAVFLVFLFNQTHQLALAAERIDPALGAAVFWGGLALWAALIGLPLILFLRLPKPVALPDAADPEEMASYFRHLRARLAANPRLRGTELETREQIEAALDRLAAEADEIVRRRAGAVFLSTAVSQSGRLDGLVVLVMQSVLIWEIARLYFQRPSPRDLLRLYRDVAITAFVAASIEEIDVGEQIEPMMGAALAPLAGAVPGLQTIANVVTSSLVSGSANAFLTLRIGVLARRYCGARSRVGRGVMRRAATAEAAQMLGGIVTRGSAEIVKATGSALRQKVGRKVGKAAWWKEPADPEPEVG
jgi:hypothetical protein